jgi:sulfate adenylyltransferase subunit 2
MRNYNLNHLEQLEAEAIFVLRETAAQFENPGLPFFWRKRLYYNGLFGS